MEQKLRAMQRPCQTLLQGWQDLGLPLTRVKGAQATQLHWAGLFSVPCGAQLCPGQALILHTGFCSLSPSLTKNLSVLSRSKPPCWGHSAPP